MLSNSVHKELQARLTTVEMVQQEGRGPTIDLVTWGREEEVLDELIDALGKLRAELNPPVPERLDDCLQNIVSASAMTLGRTRSGELLLAVCHPGFGWLTFGLSEPVRAGLAEGLLKL
jgi:hypothetical protein